MWSYNSESDYNIFILSFYFLHHTSLHVEFSGAVMVDRPHDVIDFIIMYVCQISGQSFVHTVRTDISLTTQV